MDLARRWHELLHEYLVIARSKHAAMGTINDVDNFVTRDGIHVTFISCQRQF